MWCFMPSFLSCYAGLPYASDMTNHKRDLLRKGTNFFRNPKIVHTFAPAPAGCGTTAPFIASHYAAASASVAGAFSLRTGCRLPASFWRRRYEQYLPPGCIYNIKHTKAMIKIGQYNILRVSRFVEFGLYLVSDEDDTAPRRAGTGGADYGQARGVSLSRECLCQRCFL